MYNLIVYLTNIREENNYLYLNSNRLYIQECTLRVIN